MYAIITPCYNEEKVITRFLKEIESKLIDLQLNFLVVVVDDGSTDKTIDLLKKFNFNSNLFEFQVVKLNINSGHQGAIRQGLIYTHGLAITFDGVIVMDSDGEDDPLAIKELIKNKNSDIVFVSRGKRKENLVFKIGYFFYKKLFKIITSHSISFGNYSMISINVLNCIYNQKFYHFAAFLSKQKFEKSYIKFHRQKRIDGKSKMNLSGLIIHGLRSLIEYSEEILIVFLKIFVFVFLCLITLGSIVLYKKFITHEAILGWTSVLSLVMLNSCLIMFGNIAIFLLLISIKNNFKQSEITFSKVLINS